MPPPSRLGPYVLFEPVARRTLTITYRAEHAELHRKVLVKTLKPSVSVTSAFAQELEREAHILGAMSHEAILELYEFVRTADAMWLVLEDPGGVPLSDILARAPRLDVDVAHALATEIARGLGHAHERGIVHRALRPEHVLVVPSGGIKILEFGAAHAPRLPSAPEPFETDATFGRPDYLAPELILGETAGPRSDVYSLGVVLYEAIAGARPFTGDVAKRARTAPPPPLPREVPRSVERIVLRCLAKEPDDRYQDGRELCAALEDALAERTHVPNRVLVTRALAAAGLGSELAAPSAAGRVAPRRPPLPVLPTAAALAVVFGLVVLGGALVELLSRDEDAGAKPSALEGSESAGRGYLRVLAHPWADVLVDGELIDTTPIGRGIPVSPGRHFVTFRHPHAPEERRSVKVALGQTVLVDVTMRIDRAPVDAGRPPDAAVSP